MKREFLKKLGIEDNSIIDAILDENGSDLERERSKFGDYTTIKEELSEAKKKLKGFEGVDVAELTKERDGLKEQIETLKGDNAKALYDIKLEHAISTELTKAGARNSKAVKALLNMEGVKLEDDKLVGLSEQLEQLKTDSGYLFDSSKKTKTPSFAGKASGGGTNEITKEAFNKMGYRERLQLKHDNPELYDSMGKE